jgi:hypothetical protein
VFNVAARLCGEVVINGKILPNQNLLKFLPRRALADVEEYRRSENHFKNVN